MIVYDGTEKSTTITVRLEELMSPNDPTVINNDLVHPITRSFWIFRDNSLTSGMEPAAAHQAGDGLPIEFSLGQNVPNAFSSQTEIPFALPEARLRSASPWQARHVTLAVYDVLGREVARLVEGELEAGYHRAVFDASGMPAGVYVYRLEAGEYVESRRMVVAR